MDNHAYIEVLMATYNGERFVAEQIDSILGQTHQNLHLLIRDDNSTDRTTTILEEKVSQYPGRITIIETEKNLGVIQNFSALMQEATAEYVMLADQDDVWFPDKVEKTLKKMQELEKTSAKNTPLLVHTDLRVVNQRLEEIAPSFWQYTCLSPSLGDSIYKLLGQNVVTGCTLMMNHSLLKQSLPIPVGAAMHDHWIALVAAKFGKIDYINSPTMLYRQHDLNQVGAQGGGSAILFNKLIKNRRVFVERIKKSLQKQVLQAEIFLERYEKNIPPCDKKAIQGFCRLLRGSFFQKLHLTNRFGTIKSGFIKNVGLLFIRINDT